MKTGFKVAAVAAALAFAGSAVAADPAAGEAAWNDGCADCHEASEFAGKPAADLTTTLKGLADGSIKHKPKVKLSEEEVASIVAFLTK